MIWALLAAGFVVGSIPFGYLIGKAKGVDVRSVGSGNIGATNVYRVLGAKAGAAVFALDVLKGFVPAAVAWRLLGRQEEAFACGAAAVVGHSFSPFLGLKGGKGIATGLGMLLGSSPAVAFSAFGVFFFVMMTTMTVSLASVAAGFSVILFGILYNDPASLWYAYGALGIYIAARHRANLARVRAGAEPKFGQKPGEPPPASGRSRAHAAILGVAMAVLAFLSHVLK